MDLSTDKENSPRDKSGGLGDLQFLQCGRGRTFKEPPARMPDTPQSINWRFLLVGIVDLQQGQIREAM